LEKIKNDKQDLINQTLNQEQKNLSDGKYKQSAGSKTKFKFVIINI